MTIDESRKYGTETLTSAGISDAGRDTALLLRSVLRKDHAFLISHSEVGLTSDEAAAFDEAIRRRAAGEPCQYINRKQEFFGLEFTVTPDVLIPRPETEILVEAAIRHYVSAGHLRFLEVGVGSGCISIAILRELKNAEAIAVDISPNALTVAAANAENLGVKERLDLRLSDLFQDVPERDFDFIVSNPPYVPDTELASLQREVRDFEPHIALSGGPDGLRLIRRIVEFSPPLLKSSGRMFLEIGWDQKERVTEALKKRGWTIDEALFDLQGIPRILVARYQFDAGPNLTEPHR